jgi:pantothenate kinase
LHLSTVRLLPPSFVDLVASVWSSMKQPIGFHPVSTAVGVGAGTVVVVVAGVVVSGDSSLATWMQYEIQSSQPLQSRPTDGFQRLNVSGEMANM